jgi:hypothetical protein
VLTKLHWFTESQISACGEYCSIFASNIHILYLSTFLSDSTPVSLSCPVQSRINVPSRTFFYNETHKSTGLHYHSNVQTLLYELTSEVVSAYRSCLKFTSAQFFTVPLVTYNRGKCINVGMPPYYDCVTDI